MSVFKDFSELHIGLKTAIITVLCQMPFFFISLYLFRYDLVMKVSDRPFSDMDFWFLVCLTFCFALTWFFLNVAMTFILVALVDRITKIKSKPHEMYVASMIYSIVYLSIAIVISYRFKLSMVQFLFWSYSFILIRILCSLLWNWKLKKLERG
jgi:hypothetical protein